MARRFDAIPAPTSIQDAVERGVPLVMVSKATGDEALLLAIEFEILTTAGRLNLNAALTIKPGQSQVAAQAIFENFRTESLEDIKLAFKRGSCGLYGEIYRLDGAVLVRWIQCYLEEKYQVVEHIQAKQKQAQREDDNFDPKEFYKRVSEWADKKKEIEDEKKRLANEDRRKEALHRMQQLNAGERPKFNCDGVVVTATNEKYARMAYKEMFDKEPEVVEALTK